MVLLLIGAAVSSVGPLMQHKRAKHNESTRDNMILIFEMGDPVSHDMRFTNMTSPLC